SKGKPHRIWRRRHHDTPSSYHKDPLPIQHLHPFTATAGHLSPPSAVISNLYVVVSIFVLYHLHLKLSSFPSLRIGANLVPLIVTKTSWPCYDPINEGEEQVVYSGMYLRGLVNHLKLGRGTPLRKEGPSEVYVYEMFDTMLSKGL
nr:glycoside hydrolase, catalytic domain-containing protein [Tanacetum cinerariifolium]